MSSTEETVRGKKHVIYNYYDMYNYFGKCEVVIVFF